jgi:hypothetical protein
MWDKLVDVSSPAHIRQDPGIQFHAIQTAFVWQTQDRMHNGLV